MRRFHYYLYENFDAGDSYNNPDNPRKYMDDISDNILSDVVNDVPFSCRLQDLYRKYSVDQINARLEIGLLKRKDPYIVIGSSVFLQEDAGFLRTDFLKKARGLVEALEKEREKLTVWAQKIKNGFSAERNLYHILCGTVFDGLFFDCLSQKGIISTSRKHPSGLDYILTAYEICPALDCFSRKLLCSYNRFTDGRRTLLSFGDSDGDRKDFYRFSRQKESGTVPPELTHIQKIWDSFGTDSLRTKLLDETEHFIKDGDCEPLFSELLVSFGYSDGEKMCVPVYYETDKEIFYEIEKIVENCLLGKMETIFSSYRSIGKLVCARHGVAIKEIGNELYHIIFGLTNNELVSRGFVSSPPYRQGEGRYFKAVEIME